MYIIAQIANSKKIIQSTDKQSFIVLIVTCKLDFQNCIYITDYTGGGDFNQSITNCQKYGSYI